MPPELSYSDEYLHILGSVIKGYLREKYHVRAWKCVPVAMSGGVDISEALDIICYDR